MKRPGKKTLIGLVVVLSLSAGVAAYFLLIKDKNDTPNSVIQENLTDETPEINNVVYPGIEEIKKKHGSSAERYSVLMAAASDYLAFKNYDEAFAYFDAALAEIEPSDTAKRERALFSIYKSVLNSGQTEKADSYKQQLGDDALNRIENELLEADENG